MAGAYTGPLERVSDCCWRIPKSYKPGMRVDGLIYADDRMIEAIRSDSAPEQVANVAFLPGIQLASLAMPDIHWGYGFCIGGVCATDPRSGGVISPGGVGYDINCGVRLVRTDLSYDDVKPRLKQLVEELFRQIPAGVGQEGRFHYTQKELRQLMAEGPSWLIPRGCAVESDIDHTEALGRLDGAQPDDVSVRALERGRSQCGTLGAGNHFLEVQVVDEIVDEEAAAAMGLAAGRVCVMIHSGSRGLGYQVCDDALRELRGAPEKYGIALPDRQLVCAGRQLRGAALFRRDARRGELRLVQSPASDVAGPRGVSGRFRHALGKAAHEPGVRRGPQHRQVRGAHDQWRKPSSVGASQRGHPRLPPGHPEVPDMYRRIGQPVIIPGDMGRASWVLAGQDGSMQQTFGTACHGAGRRMSRTAAVKHAQGRRIDEELAARGVIARARSWRGLAEEQPDAYKDVNHVVDVVHRAGLAKKVARMRPIGVIKG